MADRIESKDSSDPAEATAGPARRVFISYASHDAAVAQKVCSALEGAGFPCWLAPRDVVPGMLYADGIVRAINESTILVLILSESAVASAHVGKELERASSKRHPIIALRTDSAPLTPAFEYFLSESQWIDVGAGGIDAAIALLVGAVHQHLLPGATATPIPSRAAHAVKRPAATPRWTWVIAGAVIVFALAAAYFFANKIWLHDRSASAIRVGAGPSETVGDKSIAVLPFTDMSEKHDQEYFGDGMAEEILDLLAKIPGLTVIGRTSSFQFKGKNEDLRTIGTKLNAAYVLEGSVRKSGDQVRITAQLINTKTGAHDWSETYDRHIGDVLKLQDAIAAAVVRELQLTVASGYLNSRSTLKNAEAYDLYLRGRHAADRWDQEGLEEAVTLFQQALDRDPTSADAAAELAAAYESQGEDGFLKPPAAAFEQARRETATALKLDPKNARVHYVLGLIHVTYDWDWAAAEREFQQATTLSPGSAYALCGEAVLSLALGRWDDALRQIKASLAQDPLDTGCIDLLSQIQVRRGHLPEAEAAWRRVLEIRPTYGFGHYYLGLVLLARGDRDAALREMQQETSDLGKQQGLAIVYYALGRKAESDTALAWLLKEHAQTEAFLIAEVYASRGQPDEAMHWLERAYAQKDVNLLYIKGDPLLKSLEADPRYIEFLRKMNLPE
jgi:TolB-like protein/Flp pilus assembly protein TadD